MLKQYCDRCGKAVWFDGFSNHYPKGFGKIQIGGECFTICDDCEDWLRQQMTLKIRIEGAKNNESKT